MIASPSKPRNSKNASTFVVVIEPLQLQRKEYNSSLKKMLYRSVQFLKALSAEWTMSLIWSKYAEGLLGMLNGRSLCDFKRRHGRGVGLQMAIAVIISCIWIANIRYRKHGWRFVTIYDAGHTR